MYLVQRRFHTSVLALISRYRRPLHCTPYKLLLKEYKIN